MATATPDATGREDPLAVAVWRDDGEPDTKSERYLARRLAAAKSRLRLPADQRTSLALAFALDTLDALAASPAIAATIVVSSDPEVTSHLRRMDVAVVPDDTTWAFRGIVTAHRTDADNESAGYLIQGVIDRNSGAATTALVGSPTVTVLAEDTAAWDVAVSADTGYGSLKVAITGETGKTINWVAVIDIASTTG